MRLSFSSLETSFFVLKFFTNAQVFKNLGTGEHLEIFFFFNAEILAIQI
uniref:Uncharacterized protein n=1 Tax=Manihot esculenta TaxID=3983 RepID=A0A2C9WDR1_MANES